MPNPAILAPVFRQRFYDGNGFPLAGGSVFTYLAGSAGATLKTTWKDYNRAAANTNPIILDAFGYADIWLDDTAGYLIVVKDVLGNQKISEDNVWGPGAQNYNAFLIALAADTGASLVGFKQTGVGAVHRTVLAKLRETSITPQDFGAPANGSASDVAAINAAGANVTFPPGTYLIDANITMPAKCLVLPGASFTVSTGVTMTFPGSLDAPIAKIFNCIGTGAVTMLTSEIPVAYPEWWGAVGNDSGTDSLAALTACSIAHHETRLFAADYYTTAEWSIKLPYRNVKGMGFQYNGALNQCTRVIVASATAFVLRVGPDTYPGTINALQQQNRIENIQLTRSVAPTIGSVGLKIQWCVYTELRNVKAAENNAGFLFFGCVRPSAVDCYAFWTQLAADTGITVRGFIVDGNSTISPANGNASVYLIRCNGTIGGFPVTNSQAFYVDNKMTDCFIQQPESQNMNSGIALIGDSGTGPISTNADVRVVDATFDGCTGFGIYCQNLNKWGRITFVNPYVALAGATATDGIYITNCLGSLVFEGGEVYMANIASGSSAGITVFTSRGVIVDHTFVSECRGRAVRLSGSDLCNIQPCVQNEQASTVSTLPAVNLTNSNRNFIQASYKGVAGGCSIGVNISDAVSARNEINCTLLDPAGITGGSANKLVINGVQVTATGIAAAGAGNNLANGIMS